VVIGSGATAVTLVPAMAETAAHVTMLQRSPTYIVSLPAEDRVANGIRRLLPERAAHRLIRWKNVALGMYFYRICRRTPGRAKKLLLRRLARELPPGFDIDKHFTPHYDPLRRHPSVPALTSDGAIFRNGAKASRNTRRLPSRHAAFAGLSKASSWWSDRMAPVSAFGSIRRIPSRRGDPGVRVHR